MSDPAPATSPIPAMAESAYRACFSNLVIYTEEPEDEKLLDGVMSEYVLKHPCRIILILAQPRQSSKLETARVARTFTGTAGRTSTCDQITIHAAGSGLKEICGAVQPLLVADLPVNLWWRGMFLNQRQLVEQMLSFSDRFIYDGGQWTNLHYTVLQVADCIKSHSKKVGFTNFNWSRLRPWRECAADFFDPGIFESEVWELNRVRVEYMALPGNEEGQQFRALLLVAWLSVQLGWTAKSGQTDGDLGQLQFTDKKGLPVDTELALLPQSGPQSQGIQRVTISVDRPPKSQDFIIERDHKDHLMVLSSRTP
ncbi:MAG TPA: glucose-6-phosphate dehydrogenase assembly protein OpcA, partial [Planctomycetota bacterium]|nr:glucose-6-phosphate dehydrogenase assembly protein OpcA [Planctomycetota bacterium]